MPKFCLKLFKSLQIWIGNVCILGYNQKEVKNGKRKRDLYNKNSELTGRTYFKGDPIPEGYYPMVVMIAIQNSEGKFLMQKRSARKGGDWGVTGGHPKAGETCEQGIITEVKEELGK